jgi:hypothetical protein
MEMISPAEFSSHSACVQLASISQPAAYKMHTNFLTNLALVEWHMHATIHARPSDSLSTDFEKQKVTCDCHAPFCMRFTNATSRRIRGSGLKQEIAFETMITGCGFFDF